jgi:hypothetical protein
MVTLIMCNINISLYIFLNEQAVAGLLLMGSEAEARADARIAGVEWGQEAEGWGSVEGFAGGRRWGGKGAATHCSGGGGSSSSSGGGGGARCEFLIRAPSKPNLLPRDDYRKGHTVAKIRAPKVRHSQEVRRTQEADGQTGGRSVTCHKEKFPPPDFVRSPSFPEGKRYLLF